MPATGERISSCSTWRCSSSDEQLLPVATELLGPKFEGEALIKKICISNRVRIGQLGIAKIIFGFLKVYDRNDATFVRLFGATHFALGSDQGHIRKIGTLAFFERCLFGFDTLPLEFHLLLFERCFSLFELILQLRAVDDSKNLIFLNTGTGLNKQGQCSGSRRIQCRANSGYHTTLHRYVPNKIGAYDLGNAQSIVGNRRRGARPAVECRYGNPKRYEHCEN